MQAIYTTMAEEVFRDRETHINGRRLKRDSQLFANLILAGGDIQSANLQTPFLDRDQCTEQTKECRFTRPIWPKEAKQAPVTNGEAQFLQRGVCSVGEAERFGFNSSRRHWLHAKK